MAKKIPLLEAPGDDGQRRAPDTGGESTPNVDGILAEIRRLYFRASAATIDRDFDRAIDLLKSIPRPEDRQRATVYMQGLAEMRKEWKRRKKRRR